LPFLKTAGCCSIWQRLFIIRRAGHALLFGPELQALEYIRPLAILHPAERALGLDPAGQTKTKSPAVAFTTAGDLPFKAASAFTPTG
jgi:hypothetical protein